MSASAPADHEHRSVARSVDGVVVHARGQLTAAEHVYARDRIAQLCSLGRGGSISGSVKIVKRPTADGLVSAWAEVLMNGEVWRGRAEGLTSNLAIDDLHGQLHDRIVKDRLETTDKEE